MTNRFLMGFAAIVATVSLSACGEKASEKADDTSGENAENPAGLVQDASDAVKTTEELSGEGAETSDASDSDAEDMGIVIGEEVEEGIEEAQDMVEESDDS